jgi:hypothetical protein
LVVHTCEDAAIRVAGPAFELPAKPRALPRWSAAFGVDAGDAMRVDVANEAPKAAMLGRYVPRATTRRPLSAAAAQRLIALLRSNEGIEDDVIKRCQPGVMVGFELRSSARDVPGPAPQSTVVLDFGCSALHVRGIGSDPIATSYFDALYADFVALAREALPDDEQVAKLH